MRTANTLIVATLIAAITVPAKGQPRATQPEPWREWSRVASIDTGRAITVETRQPNRKLNGAFVSSDGARITIQMRDGRTEFISRENVRKVTGRRERLKYAPLIGMAAGIALYAKIRPTHDFTGTGHLVFGAAFAGLGALCGVGVWALGRNTLIYEAPTR